MSARAPLPLALLAVALAAVALAGLSLGQLLIGPAELLQGALTGEGLGGLVLGTIRGPRVATAIAAGAALGLSGFLFQRLFRNPLAAPDIMGFTAGAGLAVVAVIGLGLAMPAPLAAAAGGLVAAVLVAGAAWRPGHETPPLALVLVGLGVGFLATALSSFLLSSLPSNEAADAQRWLTGSLAARGWDHVAQAWGGLVLLVPLVLVQLRLLAALELGGEMAAGLGLRPGRARMGIACVAVLLAASAVAVAGPVPFVALMAPPLGARLVRAEGLLVPATAAALTGALILTGADLLARAAWPGVELPAGVVTGLLGAPYLLWRLGREMKKGGL